MYERCRFENTFRIELSVKYKFWHWERLDLTFLLLTLKFLLIMELKLNPNNIVSLTVKGENFKKVLFKHYFYTLRKIIKESVFFFGLMDTFCAILEIEVTFSYKEGDKIIPGKFNQANLMPEIVYAFLNGKKRYEEIYNEIKQSVEAFENQAIIIAPIMRIKYLDLEGISK